MSETIIQTAILVFAAGFVGFALGCLVARLFATSGSGEPASAQAPARATPQTAAAQPEQEAPAQPAAVEPPIAAPAAATPEAAPAALQTAQTPPAATTVGTSQDAAPATAPEAQSQAAARPGLLDAPRQSGADDLKQIKGVGPKLEQTLNSLGIFHFDQIADWTPENVDWVDEHLRFRGRIVREKWIEQAKTLSGK